MPHVIGLLALVSLLLLGAGGWGSTAVGVLRRAGWEEATDVVTAPLQILVGVALFLAVGGALVAGDAARFDVLFLWHLVGVALLLPRLPGVVRRAPAITGRRVVTGAALAATGVVLLLLSLAVAGLPDLATSDDDPAYIYLAQRLLHTGGLIDPFNLRRVTEYGGSTLYQSMFLRISGNASLWGFEWTFAVLVLLLVAVRTTRRHWLVPGVLVLGAGLIVGHGIGPLGPLDNLGPLFSGSALSLGVYQLLAHIGVDKEHEEPGLYVVVGLLLAGIVALRFYFVIPVVLTAIAVMVITRARDSLRGLIVTGSTALAASAGWAVASQRSSGTPLFPLIAGNYDTSGLGGSTPTLGITALGHRFVSVFNSDGIGMVVVVSIVTAVLCLALRHGDPRGLVVVIVAGFSCLIEMALFTYELRGSYIGGIARFVAPSTLACGLMALTTLWPCRSRAAPGISPPQPDPSGLQSSSAPLWRAAWASSSRARVASIVVALAFVAMGAFLFGSSPTALARTTNSYIRLGSRVVRGTVGFSDRYRLYRAEYARVNAMVPEGAKVLAAVERPGLLDFSRFDFATLDGPGSVSPAPHMPFFDGPAAKVSYLRKLGYQYIVAESPADSGLYDVNAFLTHYLRSDVFFNREQAAYFIDWAATVRYLEVSGRYAVHYSGTLALISLA